MAWYRDWETEYADLNEVWQSEKALVKGSQQLKDELDKARIAYEKANREGDYETMSKLQYETIPQLEKRIKESDLAEQKVQSGESEGVKLLRNKVTDNEIEMDSKPEALGKLDSRLIQLKMQREVLKNEEDEGAKSQLKLLAPLS